MLYQKFFTLVLLFCFGGLTLNAAVNEVIPGDYEAPSVGVNLATLYMAQKNMRGLYSEGSKITDDRVTSLVTALKLTATVDVGGYTFCPMVALPYSATNSSGQTLPQIIGEKSIGSSDIIFGTTGWLINDKSKNQYLAATLLFFAPTGKYDSHQLLNVGENRYKSTLNIGYVQKLSDDFVAELSPELAVYGQNNDSLGRTISQKASYALTAILRYNQTSKLTLFGGLQQNAGGQTAVNGEWQNDASRMQKATAGAYYYTKAGTQILLKYGKEFATQSGMRTTDDFLLRFQWWFM
jgi:hypothetical protein